MLKICWTTLKNKFLTKENFMFNTRLDKEKNRIYITLGTIETGEGEQIFNQVKSQLTLLKPGFTAVSDITSFIVKDFKEGVWADKVLKLVVEAGMVKGARITGEKEKIKKIVNEYGCTVMLVETLEEADQVLDGEQLL